MRSAPIMAGSIRASGSIPASRARIKYVTDKYGDSTDFAPSVTIPKGASFTDMLELRGKSDIGDRINTQVITPLVQANTRLAHSDFPDFNEARA